LLEVSARLGNVAERGQLAIVGGPSPTFRNKFRMKVYRDVDIKRMAWGCRGGGHIPNTEKLAIIRAKIFKIWAKYSAAFTCK